MQLNSVQSATDCISWRIQMTIKQKMSTWFYFNSQCIASEPTQHVMYDIVKLLKWSFLKVKTKTEKGLLVGKLLTNCMHTLVSWVSKSRSFCGRQTNWAGFTSWPRKDFPHAFQSIWQLTFIVFHIHIKTIGIIASRLLDWHISLTLTHTYTHTHAHTREFTYT